MQNVFDKLHIKEHTRNSVWRILVIDIAKRHQRNSFDIYLSKKASYQDALREVLSRGYLEKNIISIKKISF